MASKQAARLNGATWVTHLVAVLLFAIVLASHTAIGIFCGVVAALIALACTTSVPGRPASDYLAFGVLLSFAFRESVAAIHQGQFVELIPTLLLVAGAVWFLQQPGWPSMLFTAVLALVFIGVSVLRYRNPFDVDGLEPDEVRRSAAAFIGTLVIGLLYLELVFVRMQLKPINPTKRKSPRKIAVPTDLPD